MDKANLVGIIGFVSVFVSLLLALFLLTVKTKHKLSNALFASFLVMSAVDISGFFIFRFIHDYPGLEMLRGQMSLLIMPLFYLYILSVCYSDFTLKARYLLHALPFVISNMAAAPRFYFADVATKNRYMEDFSHMPERIFLSVLVHVQFVCYIIAIFIVLKKFREIYRENYTNAAVVTYQWLFQITMISTIAHSIVIIKGVLLYSGYEEIILWSHLTVGLIALGILCWFVLKALYAPELFRGVDSTLPLVREMLPAVPMATREAEKKEPENAGLRQQEISRLRAYMEQEEPYLEPSLTIQELANQMKMPVRDLSILINHHLDQHFFDFINEYRIQKAMGILKDPLKKAFTVQEILYEVGFNSKSSFNTAFKKYTDVTPTQYRINS